MKFSRIVFFLTFFASVRVYAGVAPLAPVVLASGQTAVLPNNGDRVVLWATWAEQPDWRVLNVVPVVILPCDGEISLNSETYSFYVSPVEGSANGGTVSDIPGTGVTSGFGRALWADSKGHYGVISVATTAGTPTNADDFALTSGTSRTLLPQEMVPIHYLRFHFPTLGGLNYDKGVVEEISSPGGNVLNSGTYSARRYAYYFELTEYATVAWFKDGVKIVRHDKWGDASPDWYDIPSYSSADRGTYTMHVENLKGSFDVNFQVGPPKSRTISQAPATGKLLNISTRALVGTGDKLLIGGCVIAGGSARILVRASGPALASALSGTLAKPTLRVFSGSKLIAENTGWGTSADAAAMPAMFSRLGAGAWAQGSADSAAILTLNAGAYTFQVTGADGGTGVSLIEIYIDTASGLPGYLANLSTRGISGSGDNVMITGFVTGNDTQVLVRGIGPALATLGVSGALAKPVLNVYDGGTKVDSIGDWSDQYDVRSMNALFKKLGAFSLQSGGLDSAVILNLQNGHGIRTAMVDSADGSSGVGLAEVYLVLP